MECVLVDGPQATPEGAGNNRYLSFVADPAGTGCMTALRVTFESLPAPLDRYNGMSLWVGRPREFSENSGKRWPEEAPGWPTFWGARLWCEPYFADWSALGTLQIYGDGLVPGAVYSIQAVEEGCDTALAENYSTSLGLSMARWGDVCAPGPGGACSGPPDGIVDVANDVLGVLGKSSNGGGAPSKPRADLEPAVPDQKINITDVMHALGAFGGQEYNFPIPEPCP